MLFSIIIPMYNAETTLDKCLSSIAGQRFQDYQVLIVNDGSTDRSPAIAKQFADRDPRFSVIPANHSGPGAARNKGLACAEGDYVLYMDADDYWIREDLLPELSSRIHTHPADVYMYQMVKVTEDGTVLQRYTKPPFKQEGLVLDLEDIYQELVQDGQTLAAAWNKCVRRDLLLEKQIRFREDVFCEDIDWVLQLFSHTQTICLLNLWAYAYTQHKVKTRSTRSDAPNDLVTIVHDWGIRSVQGNISHNEAAAGLAAFEYATCLGRYHLLSPEKKKILRQDAYLLNYGLDRKTLLIRRFCRIFGFPVTCAALRVYLFLRRIW